MESRLGNAPGPEIAPQSNAEYEAAVDHILAEIKHQHEQMANDQREIERLRADTRAILQRLKT